MLYVLNFTPNIQIRFVQHRANGRREKYMDRVICGVTEKIGRQPNVDIFFDSTSHQSDLHSPNF